MKRRMFACLPLMVLIAGGCLWDDPKPGSGRVASGPKYGIPPHEKLPKGSLEAATRVDSLSGIILAANPDVGVRPMFCTIGVPAVTAFHRGTTQLYVSDGLVGKCKIDKLDGKDVEGELAAVLCLELAKMVAEAQLQGPPRNQDRDPPYAPLVGDVRGGRTPDQTNVAEQAYFEKQNPRRRESTPPPSLDPDVLAKTYLTKAGYSADYLVKVAPLLRMAEANPVYERQLTGPRSDGLGMPNGTK
jgi:hypothetical protein